MLLPESGQPCRFFPYVWPVCCSFLILGFFLKKWGDGGGGYWLVRIEWRPARWSVCLPLIIFPCTIRSRSSILAPAHPGGPGKRAVKRLWWCGYVCYIFVFFCVLLLLLQCLYIFQIHNSFDGPTVSSLHCTLPYVPGFANLVRDASNADHLVNVVILLSVVTFSFVFSVRALPCSKCPCLCLIQCLHLHVLICGFLL